MAALGDGAPAHSFYGQPFDGAERAKRQGDDIPPRPADASPTKTAGPPPRKRPASAERIAAHLRGVTIGGECGPRAPDHRWFFMRRKAETFDQIEERIELSEEDEDEERAACSMADESSLSSAADAGPSVTVAPEYQELMRRQADSFGPFIRQPSQSLAVIAYVPPDEVLRPSALPDPASLPSTSAGGQRASPPRPFVRAKRGDARRPTFAVCTGHDPEDGADAATAGGFSSPRNGLAKANSPPSFSAFDRANAAQQHRSPTASPVGVVSFPSEQSESSSLDRMAVGGDGAATPRIQEVFDTRFTGDEEDMEL